ncbi:hypothetical protein HDV05_005908 [Chytridiales sp. JEL 0842]|nr:hypothetical protein HDV05_005908 [Chytridiales sp. JEL 0842]
MSYQPPPPPHGNPQQQQQQQYYAPPPQGQYAPPPSQGQQYAPPPQYTSPPPGQYAPPPGQYAPPPAQPGQYAPPTGQPIQPGQYAPPPAMPAMPTNSMSHPVGVATVAPPSAPYVGPFLRLGHLDINTNLWQGSVLIITNTNTQIPFLTIEDPNTRFATTIQPHILEVFQGRSFCRYNIALVQNPTMDVKYYYKLSTDPAKVWDFWVPSVANQSWRFAFYSCNGFSLDVKEETRKAMGGIAPMWNDLLAEHNKMPMFAMLGGGDQVYCDGVFKDLPAVQEWMQIKGKENRQNAPWTERLENDVTTFYFNCYIDGFSEGSVKEALARIPYVFAIDDHDVFDGCGSYPPYLQQSVMFTNVIRIAFKFYLLFQQHSTEALAPADGYFPATPNRGYNFLRRLGRGTMVLGLDTRRERTKEAVMLKESWDAVYAAADHNLRMFPGAAHVVVLAAIPMAYPRLAAADSLLSSIGGVKNTMSKGLGKLGGVLGGITKSAAVQNFVDTQVNNLKKGLGKSGMMEGMLNGFGEPELLDDLCDHWTHPNHMAERNFALSLFQQLSLTHRVRVTLLSGDVHLCGLTRFHPLNTSNPADDHLLIYNVISSAIGNVPPPGAVAKTLETQCKEIPVGDGKTGEDVVKGVLGQGHLIARRNWVVCDKLQTGLGMKWRVEGEGAGMGVSEFGFMIPDKA